MSVEPAGIIVPPACACCGSEAARSDVARLGSGAKEIIVGYCDECRRHQGSARVRRLSGALASALIGLSCIMILPLTWPPLPAFSLALVTFVAALVPVVVVVFWPSRVRAGHAADGPAVRFVEHGALMCADERWGAELARLNGATRKLAAWRESRFSYAMLAVPLVAPPLALVALNAASPLVRVVNLTGDQLVVEVDGIRRASLVPTSVESPTAGAELRVTIGEHDFVARGLDGSVLERTRAVVESGRAHLFAPASEGHCFFLESIQYGRTAPRAAERRLLEGPPHFWSLPTDLGGWFSAPPEALTAETRWTGGIITVLRQAPCELVR